MQLIAGRTAQEFNRRKRRKGAFWEDRYHATAVDTVDYLVRCMAYIDLNMVRAGVVRHPSEWPMCGYCEIQRSPKRYAVIDRSALIEVLGFRDLGQLQRACRDWIEDGLHSKYQSRDGVWSESLAVGRPEFVEWFRIGLGIRGMHRDSVETESVYVLKEPVIAYKPYFPGEIASLSGDNTVIGE
jgi:putative transposase